MIQFPSDALRSLAGAEDDPERGAFEFEVLGYAGSMAGEGIVRFGPVTAIKGA
jgi:hypothetical protein